MFYVMARHIYRGYGHQSPSFYGLPRSMWKPLSRSSRDIQGLPRHWSGSRFSVKPSLATRTFSRPWLYFTPTFFNSTNTHTNLFGGVVSIQALIMPNHLIPFRLEAALPYFLGSLPETV